MAPKRKGGDAAEAAPPVKKSRTVGVPNYLKEENLGIALAALEASDAKQTQPGIDLLAKTDELYGSNLRLHVVPTYGWPTNAGPKSNPNYSVEDSVVARTRTGGLWNRWNTEIKPYCLNTIQAHYESFLVTAQGGEKTLPSGTNKDDATRYIKEMIFDDKKRSVPPARKPAADSQAAATPDAHSPGAGEAPADADPAQEDLPAGKPAPEYTDMPLDFDGGPFFLTWLHLGPLSDGGSAAVFQPEGGSKADVGDGRSSQREKEGLSSSGEKPSVAGSPSAAPSYADIMATEVTIEAWKTQLQARKDQIEEKKLEIELASADEQPALKAALKEWLKNNPAPPQPAKLHPK